MTLGKKEQQEKKYEYDSYAIRARVIDATNGMHSYPEVSAVRIHSKEYVLLVMADYVPTLGKVDGNVSFLTPDEEVTFSNIKGFYKHQRNEFTLLIMDDTLVQTQEDMV